MPRIAALSLLMISLAACGDTAPPDKEELIRRLNNSRSLAPEARVQVYCGTRASNLCDKLRSEPKYRDTWLKTMDGLADTRAQGERLQTAIEQELAKAKADLEIPPPPHK